MWGKINLPMRVILVSQGVALAYSIHKRAHVTSVVTGMTLVGLLLGEYQGIKAATAKASTAIEGGPPGTISSISSLGDLRKLSLVT